MKKQLLTLLLCIITVSTFSQGTSTSFYGRYVDLYRGKKGLISTEYEKYQSIGIKGRPIYEVVNSVKKKKVVLDTIPLANPLDIVKETIQFDDVTITPKVNPYTKEQIYELPFTSINTGKKYILKYNTVSKFDFPFQILDPLVLPDNFFCPEIRSNTDEFTGTRSIHSPIGDDVNFSSSTKQSVTVNFITLKTTSTSLSPLAKEGVIILFQDGTKLEFASAKISTNRTSMSGYYSYISTIVLDPQELKKIQTYKIKGYRLYTEDTMLMDFEATRYMSLANCLFKQ